MKFLYIKIGNWFELAGDKYKKVGGSTAQKDGKGKAIDFLKSTQVDRCDEPVTKSPPKPKKNVPPKQTEELIEEEKSPLEELNE